MIKKDKGITLISLSIAVIIILTITGMILYSAKDSIYIEKLTNMQKVPLIKSQLSYMAILIQMQKKEMYQQSGQMLSVLLTCRAIKIYLIQLQILIN